MSKNIIRGGEPRKASPSTPAESAQTDENKTVTTAGVGALVPGQTQDEDVPPETSQHDNIDGFHFLGSHHSVAL